MGKAAWVLGAGYVGAEVAAELGARGYAVIAMRRSPPPNSSAFAWRSVDVLDPTALAAVEAAPDIVVFAIAASRVEAGAPDPYLHGLANVVRELERRGNPSARLALVSSTGVYDEADGAWVDEATAVPAANATPSPRRARLLAAEEIARSWSSTIITRLSGIYGPGRTSMIAKLLAGEARLPTRERWTNRIHRADAARAIAHVTALDAPDSTYVVSDATPAPLDEVLTWLAAQLSLPTPPVEVETAESVRAYRADGNKRCRSARLVASGFHFQFPSYREGYGALVPAAVAAARSHGATP